MNNKQQSISYGSQTIQFYLTRSNRKTLEIAVYPDQTVWITAPIEAEENEIEEKVIKRGRWIKKQQQYFDRFQKGKNNFEYVSGETHYYLGRRYLLKVNKKNSSKEEPVMLKGKYINVYTSQKDDPSAVKTLLDNWYRQRAKNKFTERFELTLTHLNKYGIKRHDWKIYDMKKRWGSFTSSGNILLNPDLIKYPTYCIDYVIIHELCHSEYPSHGKDFYRLLKTVLPDWKRRKEKLEKIN